MSTYDVDDVLILTSGETWRVDHVHRREDGRVTVGLDDLNNPGKHGTAFYADVLDKQVVRHLRGGDMLLIDKLARDLAAALVALGWRR